MHVHPASRDHIARRRQPIGRRPSSRPMDHTAGAGRPCELFHHRDRHNASALHIVTTARAPNRANRPRRSPMRFLKKRRGRPNRRRPSEARLLDETLRARGDAARERRAGSKRHNRGNRPGAVSTRHADSALPGNHVRSGTPRALARTQSAAALPGMPRRGDTNGPIRRTRSRNGTPRSSTAQQRRTTTRRIAQRSTDATMRAAHRSGNIRADHRRHVTPR